jgi:hypothetical protein
MDAELQEALEVLHDLREFWIDNVTQTQTGAGHTNGMWLRIATILDKHGMNNRIGALHTMRYCQFHPDYHPLTRSQTLLVAKELNAK